MDQNPPKLKPPPKSVKLMSEALMLLRSGSESKLLGSKAGRAVSAKLRSAAPRSATGDERTSRASRADRGAGGSGAGAGASGSGAGTGAGSGRAQEQVQAPVQEQEPGPGPGPRPTSRRRPVRRRGARRAPGTPGCRLLPSLDPGGAAPARDRVHQSGESYQITRRAAKGSRGGRPPAFDPNLYAQRNVVERCFDRLEQFRGLATRYAKRVANYRSEIVIASIMLWLRTD